MKLNTLYLLTFGSLAPSYVSPFTTTAPRTSPRMPFHLSAASTGESLSGKEVSPLFYAAAGSPTVDMNKYNLPLEEIVNEWTAIVQPGNSMQDEV